MTVLEAGQHEPPVKRDALGLRTRKGLDLGIGSDRDDAPSADRDRGRGRAADRSDRMHTSTMQDEIGSHAEHDRL